jgi:hypothetical protein
MLHHIKVPDVTCQSIFKKILVFQRQVLAFACDLAITLPLTQSSVDGKFGAASDWFWRKLHFQSGANAGSPNDLYRALESVMRHVQATPGIGKIILEAFDNDICFQDHIEDPSFRFSCVTLLDEPTRDALKPLMVAFYERLLCEGFPSGVVANGSKFNRDSVVRSFWSSNSELNVCPACDGQRPDSTSAKCGSSADHYLPKSSYLFLSVHPANLVPVCSECNLNFKASRDPIDDATDAPLMNLFIPYYRAALDFITVNTSKSATGALQFSIVDADGSRSRRVENLVRTYQLEERWFSRRDQVTGSIREALSHHRRILERHGMVLNEGDFRHELDEMAKDRTDRIGRDYNYVLHTSYLRYAATDPGESAQLLRQFRGA